MEVAAEGVGVLGAEVGLDAANGEIHHRQAAGGGVALLPVDADVAELAAVGFDEFFRLDKHAAGAAAGVVDAAFVGREHLDETAHDAGRGVELAAVLALGAGELGEEILVNAAQKSTERWFPRLAARPMVPMRSISSPRRCLSRPGRA